MQYSPLPFADKKPGNEVEESNKAVGSPDPIHNMTSSGDSILSKFMSRSISLWRGSYGGKDHFSAAICCRILSLSIGDLSETTS